MRLGASLIPTLSNDTSGTSQLNFYSLHVRLAANQATDNVLYRQPVMIHSVPYLNGVHYLPNVVKDASSHGPVASHQKLWQEKSGWKIQSSKVDITGKVDEFR